MRFDVVTLFPELFAPHLTHGITRRAFGPEGVDVRLWPLRDFADDTYRRVDDRPYGGGPGAVMLCGRYEGIDQRLLDRHVTHELSLGDFVLSGGELPALALLDAVARLQPGVLSAPSHLQDSFSDGLLEGPQYSRPEVLNVDGSDFAVPPVLLSGHHGQVAAWKRQQSLAITARRRPDLIDAARTAGRLSREDEKFLVGLGL